VRKIAAAFGARLWYPKEDMKIAEKKEIVKDFNISNDHESDALAAALLAKNRFLDTIEKIERNVEQSKQGIVKKLLITGQAANIETALETETTGLRKQLEMKKYDRNESSAIRRLRESSAKMLAEKNAAIRGMEKIIEGEYIQVISYSDTLTDKDVKNNAIIIDRADDRTIRRIEHANAAAIITEAGVTTTLPMIERRKANIRQLKVNAIFENDKYIRNEKLIITGSYL